MRWGDRGVSGREGWLGEGVGGRGRREWWEGGVGGREAWGRRGIRWEESAYMFGNGRRWYVLNGARYSHMDVSLCQETQKRRERGKQEESERGERKRAECEDTTTNKKDIAVLFLLVLRTQCRTSAPAPHRCRPNDPPRIRGLLSWNRYSLRPANFLFWRSEISRRQSAKGFVVWFYTYVGDLGAHD